MNKIKMFLASAAMVVFSSINAQDMCAEVKAVADASANGFESLKGKYTASDYDGVWAANAKITGAKSCNIEENTGWFVATFASTSEGAANAEFKKLKTQLGACLSGWSTWDYDNIGEHLKTSFYSESKNAEGADGGQYGNWAKKRGYESWDAAPKGKTVELELRQKNGKGEGWEVRIKIYNAM